MATKLEIWNRALIAMGRAVMTSTDDDVEPKYIFDVVWDAVVDQAFSRGDWNFAKKIASLSPSGSGSAGFANAFDYPDDYLRTVAVGCTVNPRNEQFREFADQDGQLHANADPLYLIYISSAATTEFASWPPAFAEFVVAHLAFTTCGSLTGSSDMQDRIEKRATKTLLLAKNIDARNENNKSIGRGSWIKARQGGWCGPGSSSNSGGGGVNAEITPGEGDV
ncbi:hypothetical protein [Agrobacterium vitis]|uniref:hypothetical protein n=1 Tax=Agrobacterium vitis TaxID=373 RepID=UPI0012EA5BEE|nr:hypothetical protein [Agrobacterium vitis]MUO85573.1 hypothetical protein [Agrobacterium vitis]